jgi:two-component system sensor histidine kinase KdpD
MRLASICSIVETLNFLKWRRAWPGAAIWATGWALLLLLDGRVDLANQALVLVATAALATLWLPGWVSGLAALAAVAAFNWSFVPPRHSFSVDVEQHALLLATLLVVVWTVAALVTRQKRLATAAARDAQREARLRTWGDALRDASDPTAHAGTLQSMLVEAAGVPVALRLRERADRAAEGDDALQLGAPDADQRAGLALCLREGRPLGPGSGRYEEQPDVYLPLRGRGQTLGATVLQGLGRAARSELLLSHLQALCDQMGQALLRAQGEREAQRLRDAAQDQATRSALLTAIAHDHRTPLATILGAASSLAEQGDRLDAAQRRRLAQGIVDEAGRLARLTDNTLQLARLDAPGVQLACDWESAEELVGAALQRARRRGDGQRLKAWVEPALPLLWCDALLMSQLLDNLVDNALKYSPADAPVEISARRQGDELVLAVRDRGEGVPPAWRERIFEVFRRGEAPTMAQRPGAGVGLAVCRAIARAHGGALRLRTRAQGGSAFECVLPLHAQPALPQGQK